MKIEQHLPNGFGDEVSHSPFIVELYFAFRGMNVHVHRGRINFQEQTANRIPAFHQRGVVAFKERVIESAIFDRAAVHKEMPDWEQVRVDLGQEQKKEKLTINH